MTPVTKETNPEVAQEETPVPDEQVPSDGYEQPAPETMHSESEQRLTAREIAVFYGKGESTVNKQIREKGTPTDGGVRTATIAQVEAWTDWQPFEYPPIDEAWVTAPRWVHGNEARTLAKISDNDLRQLRKQERVIFRPCEVHPNEKQPCYEFHTGDLYTVRQDTDAGNDVLTRGGFGRTGRYTGSSEAKPIDPEESQQRYRRKAPVAKSR